MAKYEQPTKSEIAKKLADASMGEKPDWEGFITWVNDQIDMAFSRGYEEGHQDGADDVEDDDEEVVATG